MKKRLTLIKILFKLFNLINKLLCLIKIEKNIVNYLVLAVKI